MFGSIFGGVYFGEIWRRLTGIPPTIPPPNQTRARNVLVTAAASAIDVLVGGGSGARNVRMSAGSKATNVRVN